MKSIKNLQLVFLIIILAVLVLSGIRLWQWNRGDMNRNEQTEDAEPEEDFEIEILDQVYELTAQDLAGKKDDGKETILCLGNDSFAWDYEGGVTAAIAEATGAEVVNGAFPGSTVTDMGQPDDAFSFVRVAEAIAGGDFGSVDARAVECREEDYSYQISVDHLRDIDYAALDTILVFYDATDYVNRRSPYNPDADKMWTDTATVAGAIAVGCKQIRTAYPHIRIAVVTPMLVTVYTPEGQPIAADRYDFGHGKLEAYVNFTLAGADAAGVTGIDNYHGMTEEDNANGYMADTTHLSQAGAQALARHVKKALGY